MDGVLPPAAPLREVLNEGLEAAHDLLHGEDLDLLVLPRDAGVRCDASALEVSAL